MAKYDENLEENGFLLYLKEVFPKILHRAARESWLVCVPRSATVNRSALTHRDVIKHILVPDLENDGLYTTLTDKRVVLHKDAVIINESSQGESDVNTKVAILFTEIAYDAFGKYKMLCLEHPMFCEGSPDLLITMVCIDDAINLLSRGKGELNVMKALDKIASDLCCSHHIRDGSSQLLQQCFSSAYSEGCSIVLTHPWFKEKTANDAYYYKLVCLAVNSYLLYKSSHCLMASLCIVTADIDSQLNHNICNAVNIAKSDLNITCRDDILANAKQELQSIGNFKTVLEKHECIKRTISVLNLQSGNISSDELLPYLVLLMIRASLSNWHAQIHFLKAFHYSVSFAFEPSDEEKFNVATLEAALHYIQSGNIFYMKSSVQDHNKEDSGYFMLKSEADSMGVSEVNPSISSYFQLVKEGSHEQLKLCLKESSTNTDSDAVKELLCHPLCNCDSCTNKMQQHKIETTVPTLNSRDSGGRTALHIACAFGWPKVVKVLLKAGAAVDSRDNSKNTALHYAAQKGHKNCLLLLLHAEASVDAVNTHHNTPLHMAAMMGHSGCVKGLLFYSELHGSINCNIQNSSGDTPLHLACKWGYRESVTVLLDRLSELGCNLTLLNRTRLTPADACHNLELKKLVNEACAEIGSAPVLQEEAAAHTNSEEFTKVPGLISSSRKSSTDSGCLSQSSSYLNAQRTPQASPTYSTAQHSSKNTALARNKQHTSNIYETLMKALRGDKTSNVDSSLPLCHPLCQCSSCALLLPPDEFVSPRDREELLNTTGLDGLGVLHLTCSHGDLESASSLLRFGCDPNLAAGSNLYTPLHLAAQKGLSQVALELLSYKANPNLADSSGNTALHLAVLSGSVETVQLLVKANADVTATNMEEELPQDLVSQVSYSEKDVKILMQLLVN